MDQSSSNIFDMRPFNNRRQYLIGATREEAEWRDWDEISEELLQRYHEPFEKAENIDESLVVNMAEMETNARRNRDPLLVAEDGYLYESLDPELEKKLIGLVDNLGTIDGDEQAMFDEERAKKELDDDFFDHSSIPSKGDKKARRTITWSRIVEDQLRNKGYLYAINLP